MSDELLLQRAFPVIEGIPDQLYAETVERGFKDFLPPEKNLSYITTCEKVKRDYLEDFQNELYNGLSEFGYPYKKLQLNDPDKIKIDRWIGKFLYEKMNITPTIAATLGMWQFMNLFMFSSVVYWRWGDVKDRFLGIRRNYFGTQWWRHYFFTEKPETSREYMFMTEDEIVALYERAGTRGLPNQVNNNVLWYRKLCSKYKLEHQIAARLYREVIKRYNAELGYRNYFALNQEDLFAIYEQVFISCIGMKIEDIESEDEENILEESDSIQPQNNEKIIDPIAAEPVTEPIPTIRKKVVVKAENIQEVPKKKVIVVKKAGEKITQPTESTSDKVESTKKDTFIFADNSTLIQRNFEKNGIEITFMEAPREITKFRIKQAGFKYSGPDKKWFAPDTEEVLAALKNIFNF